MADFLATPRVVHLRTNDGRLLCGRELSSMTRTFTVTEQELGQNWSHLPLCKGCQRVTGVWQRGMYAHRMRRLPHTAIRVGGLRVVR